MSLCKAGSLNGNGEMRANLSHTDSGYRQIGGGEKEGKGGEEREEEEGERGGKKRKEGRRRDERRAWKGK